MSAVDYLSTLYSLLNSTNEVVSLVTDHAGRFTNSSFGYTVYFASSPASQCPTGSCQVTYVHHYNDRCLLVSYYHLSSNSNSRNASVHNLHVDVSNSLTSNLQSFQSSGANRSYSFVCSSKQQVSISICDLFSSFDRIVNSESSISTFQIGIHKVWHGILRNINLLCVACISVNITKITSDHEVTFSVVNHETVKDCLLVLVSTNSSSS